MSGITICITIIFFLLMFVALGVPIGFSLFASSTVGILLFLGTNSLTAIANIAWGAVNEFTLTAIPLFLLMSEIILISGCGADMFDALYKVTSKMPGSLAVASIVACAIFGAVTGTGVGVAAIVGGIAIPEMQRRNYHPMVYAGAVAGASGIGMVIPPSVPFILYGVITEVSVGKLFISGIVPGLITTAMYAVYTLFAAKKYNQKQNEEEIEQFTAREKLMAFMKALPVFGLIIAIIGGIYLGVTTTTEAAALGVLLSLVIALAKKRLTWKGLWEAAKKSIKASSMIFVVVIGAMLFAYVLTISQVPQAVASLVLGLNTSRWVIFAAIMILFLILGMLMDASSVLLISMPIIFPIISALGFDPIWFAVVTVINLCAGVVSPPVGLVSYVVKEMCGKDVPLTMVFRSIFPYIAIDIIAIIFFCIFPGLCTFLV